MGQLVFRHRRREVRALLYNRRELVAKRVPSAAQLAALERALAARRRCPDCGRDVGYCIPTSLGRCVDCFYPDLVADEPYDQPEAHHCVEARDEAA